MRIFMIAEFPVSAPEFYVSAYERNSWGSRDHLSVIALVWSSFFALYRNCV